MPMLSTSRERWLRSEAFPQAIRGYRSEANFTPERLGEFSDLNPKWIGGVERAEKATAVDAPACVAAAAVPLRNVVVMAQNGATVHFSPTKASVSAAIAR